MDIGNLIIAILNYSDQFLNDPFFLANFIKTWGWLVFIFPMIWMAHEFYVNVQVAKNRSKWKWILLAIDVPKDNEQGPKAVENIFAHLAGAHASQDIQEIHFQGETQRWFSFEIVSIEGYVQFLIWTEQTYRNLVEAAIYAQYPDAEITEVEDYTKGVPNVYPDDEWDVWGADFKMVRPQWYPIKTHKEYEDSLAKAFHDPMTALVETMSRMGPNEQLWMQILIKPIGVAWKEKGYELIDKLAGRQKKKIPETVMSKVGSFPGKVLDTVVTELGVGAGYVAPEKKQEMPSMMLHLTPGEKNAIEAIENKLSKIGFSCKMRILYLGKKGYFKKSNAVQAIVGSIKQFNTENLNAIIPDMKRTAVTAHYFFTESRRNWRKTKLVNWYKARSHWCGTEDYVLNTEELATLWHFPVTFEKKAPMLAQTLAKKAEAPSGIPTGIQSPFKGKAHQAKITEPPSNLPA